MTWTSVLKMVIPCLQEKPLNVETIWSVPQTNTGGQGENPKALELNLAKELGKLIP